MPKRFEVHPLKQRCPYRERGEKTRVLLAARTNAVLARTRVRMSCVRNGCRTAVSTPDPYSGVVAQPMSVPVRYFGNH